MTVMKNPFPSYTNPNNSQHWEEIFLWWPTKVNNSWLWLEKIYRKKVYDVRILVNPYTKSTMYVIENPYKFKYMYGTIFDILKE